jgi:hypothetical protein
MKTLKFTPDLCQQIFAGTKTSTWRLFDDKDLKVGDAIQFINKATGESFGVGEITSLHTKTLGSLEESDWVGHDRFNSEADMLNTFRDYYGDRVTLDTEVKILHFNFNKI